MTDQKPPSNEAMGKVIMKWKGWKTCLTCMIPDDCGFYDFPGFIEESDDGSCNPIRDPRCNTDAALELERWVEMNAPYRCEPDEIHEAYTWWKFQHADGTSDSIEIPVSGQGRRTAVCNLAVKVTGVE